MGDLSGEALLDKLLPRLEGGECALRTGLTGLLLMLLRERVLTGLRLMLRRIDLTGLLLRLFRTFLVGLLLILLLL